MKLIVALVMAKETHFSCLRTGVEASAMAARAVRWLGEATPVHRVNAATLRQMVRAMVETGLGPASCNRHLSALRPVLAQAGLELPMPWQREPRGRTRWLTADEVTHLAQACLPRKHGAEVASLVRFLAETGLRVGEALALTWECVDLASGRPHVQVTRAKNGDSRWVPLTPDAVHAARTQLVPDRKSKGPWYGLSQSTVNHVFRAAREAVDSTRGDREVVVHTLRHTCASRLVRAGVSAPVVQDWLGHRDYRSTLRYVHVDQDGLANAARLLQEHR